MTYENIKAAVFLDRPNRFIANIEIDGRREVCHVKNTGRCRELLIPGARIFVQECVGERRKTKYDLISVRKGDRFPHTARLLFQSLVFSELLQMKMAKRDQATLIN